MSAERLQKILSRFGVASRRRAEDLIRAGRVTVNGQPATIGDKADPERDSIKVDGRRLGPPPAAVHLLLNKPTGYLTSRSDPEGRPTVFDLVPARLRRGLVAVGRLDFDSEGLLLLTTDGELAQRIAHPRYGCTKTYAAKVKGVPTPSELDKLRQGIVLAGRRTRPAKIEPLERRGGKRAPSVNSWWRIEIGEGRTRQIREMFFRIGHPVLRLERIAIGGLADPRLPPGQYRVLEPSEIRRLLAQTDSTAPGGSGGKAHG